MRSGKMKAVFIVLMSICLAFAAGQGEKLEVGDKVPSFTGMNGEGGSFHSDSLLGEKNIVIYFYPAAMTEGCVKQACAYRDTIDILEDYDAKVIGVSGDSVETLSVFKDEYMLKFTLLADPEANIAKKFNVSVSEGGETTKNIDGKVREFERGATFGRWTFVIDKEGEVVYKKKNVIPEEDSENVLEVLKKIEGAEE